MAKNKTCDNCSFKHSTHAHCLRREFVDPLPKANTCEFWVIKEEEVAE